jgi:hypothetical protein
VSRALKRCGRRFCSNVCSLRNHLGFRGISNDCLGYPSRAFPITNNTSRYRRKLFIYKGLKLDLYLI